MKKIPLTKGKVALVDDDDFEVLNAHRWHASGHRQKIFYASRCVRTPDGAWIPERMHRVILSRKLGRVLVKGEQVDHVSGDGLDNRRDNLRSATIAQNLRNCFRRRTAIQSSRYLGVSWHNREQQWQARIGVSYKRIELGWYQTEIEAALAREFYISAHPELGARSNFSQHELTL